MLVSRKHRKKKKTPKPAFLLPSDCVVWHYKAHNSSRNPHWKKRTKPLFSTAKQKNQARTNVADTRERFLSRQESFQELQAHAFFFPMEFSYRTPILWNTFLAFPLNQRL
jgi:hypothetical protein